MREPSAHPQLDVDERCQARLLKAQGWKLMKITRFIQKMRKDRSDGKLAGPSRSSVHRVITARTFKIGPRKPHGRKPHTTAAEDAKLPGIIEKLEKRYPTKDVYAPMINAHWKTKKAVSDATLRRRLKKMGRPWRRARRKFVLSAEQKSERAGFGQRNKKRSVKYWKTKVLAIDGKSWPWHTSVKGRKIARTMRKTGSYRLASEGIKRSAPSKKKHRQGAISVQIVAGFGAGKCRMWTEIESVCAAEYVRVCRYHLHGKALKTEDGTQLTLLRDNCPKSFASNLGKAKEASLGFSVLPLSGYSADLSPPDYTFWTAIENRMEAEEAEWPEGTFEKLHEFKARLKRTALSLPPEVIDKGMASMKRRCEEVYRTGGEWLKDD